MFGREYEGINKCLICSRHVMKQSDEMSMINKTPTGMINMFMRITYVSGNVPNERINLNT
jgi:hypothetical protein